MVAKRKRDALLLSVTVTVTESKAAPSASEPPLRARHLPSILAGCIGKSRGPIFSPYKEKGVTVKLPD